MLDQLRSGDTVIVWKLDRLARSTRDLLETMETIRDTGARFRSLSEPRANTTTPRLVLVQGDYRAIPFARWADDNRSGWYVGVSRPKTDVRVFADDAEALRRAIMRDPKRRNRPAYSQSSGQVSRSSSKLDRSQ